MLQRNDSFTIPRIMNNMPTYTLKSPGDNRDKINANSSKIDRGDALNPKALTEAQKANLRNLVTGILKASKGELSLDKLSMTADEVVAYLTSGRVKIDPSNQYQVTIALMAYQELKGENKKVEISFTEKGDLQIVVRGSKENPDYKIEEYKFSKEELAEFMPQENDNKKGIDEKNLNRLGDKIKDKIKKEKEKKESANFYAPASNIRSNIQSAINSDFLSRYISAIMSAKEEIRNNLQKIETEAKKEEKAREKKLEEKIAEKKLLIKKLAQKLEVLSQQAGNLNKIKDLVSFEKSLKILESIPKELKTLDIGSDEARKLIEKAIADVDSTIEFINKEIKAKAQKS